MIKLKKLFAGASVAISTSLVAVIVYSFVPPPHNASAQFIEQSTYGGVSTGSANAQAITIPNYSADLPGVVLRFTPGFINSGPATISINGRTPVALVRPSSIGNVAFSSGELQTGELTCITFNGAAYQQSCNVDMTPIGRTVEFRGAATPRGTLIEDGTCVSTTTYAALFSVIGSTYGSCSAGLFALPDSRGTMFAALDNQGANGAANRITSGGSGCDATVVRYCGHDTTTLTALQLPSITSNANNNITVTGPQGHTVISDATISSFNSGGGGGTTFSTGGAAVSSLQFSGSTNINVSSNNTAGQPHPTLNPILTGRRAIKF